MRYLLLGFTVVLLSCQDTKSPSTTDHTGSGNEDGPRLFEQVPSELSGIHFTNLIEEDFYHNSLTFDYMYNGSGVAIGDINNDGLPDIFFAGNHTPNKLYINKGDMYFEDISSNAGIEAAGSWSNGVNMVDINNDGYLDIYVCRSFPCSPRHTCLKEKVDLRRNLLFINDQKGGFTEQAATYGIDDVGQSIHSVFFDYDNDGDLDLFVTNHPQDTKNHMRYDKWKNPNQFESNKLYRNEGDNSFKDVTESAGLLDYTYSLGVIAQDLNNDGLIDLYISNDYEEPDLYYVNNGDGTFTESLKGSFKHVSFFGMGIDAGDINNDGHTDLVTLDMLAEDNYREKTQMSSMDPESFWAAVNNGYHYQYMRNCLHLNNGNGTFVEIGQLADIHRTDWSWTPLLADFDNDGYKDLYVTNGYRRDSRDKDSYKRISDIMNDPNSVVDPQRVNELLNSIPSTRIPNYLFRNNGDYTFSDISESSGVAIPSFSNGAAYADLDNDGDLDIVVNNLLDKAFIFRNKTVESGMGSYIRVKLNGDSHNSAGLGTVVSIYYGNNMQTTQQTNTRGYLSSVDPVIHFGCGATTMIDSVIIIWPDHMMQVLKEVPSDQEITVDYTDAESKFRHEVKDGTDIFTEIKNGEVLDRFQHKETIYDDYSKQVLLPHKLSQSGPCLASGDINGDGLEDFFIGGAGGQLGVLYIQDENGFQRKSIVDSPSEESRYEDVSACFIDFDNDNDQDLYVMSGGNEFPENSELYSDRLYINDGKGNFKRTSGVIPQITSSGSVVAPADFDGDGDTDLYVAGRHVPGRYPTSPDCFLLENREGKYVDITANIPELGRPGMVTSAIWADLDNDGYPELVVAGEWMQVKIFKNTAGVLEQIDPGKDVNEKTGWWSSLAVGDFDNDGDLDIVAGNLGLNYKYKATADSPFHLYSNDFDENGNLDIVLAYESDKNMYPVRGKQCSSEQIPEISKKFKTYSEFGAADLEQIYGDDLTSGSHFQVTTFESTFIENLGEMKFKTSSLPIEAQFAPVNDMIINDFDGDQNLDILFAGNLYVSEVETGRADAGTGLLLKGKGNGSFDAVTSVNSGFWADNDTKSLIMIRHENISDLIIVGNNDSEMQTFKIRHSGKNLSSR